MATPQSTTDTGLAIAACALHGNRPTALLEVLHEIRARRGGIDESDLRAVAGALNLSRAEVYGVVSFYGDLRVPAGDPALEVRVCLAEACRSRGAAELAAELEQHGVVVAPVYCLGNCALAPAVVQDGVVHGRADAASVLARIAGVPA
ncbi:MAG: NAD(P)H-dependent oxidoreductase subunit E [Devosia sp.]|nr:NAD(P)H-dependent oxidoreductase subunit E [Devosia sp.]